MTAHANCTHEATKAARAKCRRDARIALIAGDQLEARTTQTGIPIRDCEICGRRHPITRTHCTICGRASLYCHPGAERNRL